MSNNTTDDTDTVSMNDTPTKVQFDLELSFTEPLTTVEQGIVASHGGVDELSDSKQTEERMLEYLQNAIMSPSGVLLNADLNISDYDNTE